MTKYLGLKSLVLLTALFLVETMNVSPVLAQEPVAEKEAGSDADYIKAQWKYLEDFAKKDGFITRPGGLLVKRVRAGDGKFPAKIDTVSVHYSGKLVDGTEFDSTYARNLPQTFPLTGVIKGWGQALLLMREGSKWEVIVPSALAYGEVGSAPAILPSAVLHFTVELISVLGPK